MISGLTATTDDQMCVAGFLSWKMQHQPDGRDDDEHEAEDARKGMHHFFENVVPLFCSHRIAFWMQQTEYTEAHEWEWEKVI